MEVEEQWEPRKVQDREGSQERSGVWRTEACPAEVAVLVTRPCKYATLMAGTLQTWGRTSTRTASWLPEWHRVATVGHRQEREAGPRPETRRACEVPP